MKIKKEGEDGTLKLTRQEYEDILSCVNFTMTNFTRDGANKFLKALVKLEKDLWKVDK